MKNQSSVYQQPDTITAEKVSDNKIDFTNLPFSYEEFEAAKVQAHDRMLQNLIRLADWENLPYQAIAMDSDENIHSMPMWSSKKIAIWKLLGDKLDLFAPIKVTDIELSSISQWLAMWQQEGIAPQALDRFKQELNNSQINEAMAICYRNQWNERLATAIGDNGFWQGLQQQYEFKQNPALFFEQWGAVGHPFHPTSKAKMGISPAEVFSSSPEFKGSAKLTLAAIKRSHATLSGVKEAEYLDMFTQYFPQAYIAWQQSMGALSDTYLPFPVHPLQLQSRWSKDLPEGLLIPKNPATIDSFSSLSFRTVYPEGGESKPFIKLPVAIQMTSVQRTVSPRACYMGPRMSALLTQISRQDKAVAKVFSPLNEKTGLHLNTQSEIAKHYSVIFRAPLTEVLNKNEIAIPVAALMAKTPLNKSLASHVLTRDTLSIEVLLPNFRLYVANLLNGVLALYLKYGIALEAHQQNSLLVVAEDKPHRFIIRDFGGVRVHMESLQDKGLHLQLHQDRLIVEEQRQKCLQKLIHSLFVCHLGTLVSALAQDFSCPSKWFWKIVASESENVFASCQPAVNKTDFQLDRKTLLSDSWPTKALLSMRLHQSSDDLWARIPNPLSSFIK